MKKESLTAKQVQYMKPVPKKRLEVPAGPPTGLYLVVHPTGRKSWIFRYRFRGRTRGMTFKQGFPDLKLAAARAEAEAAVKDLKDGIDPAETKAEEQKREPDSAAAVADEWLDRYVKPNTRTWPEVERILNREVLPSWKDKLITEIGRTDVLRVLDPIVDSGRPILANRTLSILKRWFKWCVVDRGILVVSPVAEMRPPAKEKKRERVLDAHELAEILKATEALGFPFGPYFQFLILTAQRRGEVAGIRHDDVDHQAALWTLPSEATKPGRVHDVPLSGAAIELLERLPRFEGPYLFSTTSGERPVSGFSKTKAALDDKIAENREEGTGHLAGWRIHDLRRTCATWMAASGVPPHVLSAILNHSPGTAQGVTAIYNRFRYLEERREALEAWGQYILSLIDEQKGQLTAIE